MCRDITSGINFLFQYNSIQDIGNIKNKTTITANIYCGMIEKYQTLHHVLKVSLYIVYISIETVYCMRLLK